MFSKSLTASTGNITPYIVAAIFYLIVTLPLIKLVTSIEKRMANAERGGGPRPKVKGGAGQGQLEEAVLNPSEGGVHFEALDERPSALNTLTAPFRPSLGGAADVL